MAAYHTVVVSPLAVDDVVLSIIGEPVAGIPAHFDVLDALLVSVEYEASKPFVPIPVVPVATAKPQVPAVSVTGVALVPLLAVKVSPPLTNVVVASASATVKLYPAFLFVLTVTVSLELLTTPPPVGVIENDTVVPVLILIVSATVALTVVLAVLLTAPAIAGARTIPNVEAVITHALILREIVLT